MLAPNALGRPSNDLLPAGEERYRTDPASEYDWLSLDWPQLEEYLTPWMPQGLDSKILMLGCGNSKLSPQMHHAGYTQIVNVDFAESCINSMRSLYPEMRWEVADVLDLAYEEASFDVALDKGAPIEWRWSVSNVL
jgi:2-polyprenyl-3-methyl-5-hydroxy-6-metoxy-1,4-benzoquinol methylase